MLEQRVQQHFFSRVPTCSTRWPSNWGARLAFAAQMITDALTGGHRVLTVAQGHAALDADYLAARLAGRFEQDRPAWPPGACRPKPEPAWTCPACCRRRATRATLIVIEPEASRAAAWAEVLATAHGQEMFVVALTADDWRGQLQDTDLQLRVSAPRAARVVETQRVLVHALCDAIDQLLLGSEE